MFYELYKENILLGVLYKTGTDFPWVECSFEPTEAFAAVKSLFDKELQLVDAEHIEQNVELWKEVYAQIMALGIRIVNAETFEWCDDFLLHIEDEQAWFRYIEFHPAT